MDPGLLLLRSVLGAALVLHGAHALARRRGVGPGEAPESFERLGYRAPGLMAAALASAELVGGLLLAAGLLTPVGAFFTGVAMLTALSTVPVPRGSILSGWRRAELPLVYVGVALAITSIGPGRFSLDRLIGWDDELSGLTRAAGVLIAVILATFLAITWGRTRPEVTELPA